MFHDAAGRKLVLLLAIVASLAGSAAAVEPVGDFLAALRKRQLFDEAITYLYMVASDEHVDASVRQQVLYEQGLTVLARAAKLRDLGARQSQLDDARRLFDAFLETFPQHAMAGSARIESASILLERARGQVEAAAASDQKVPLLSAARKDFERARQQLVATEKELNSQLAKLPKLVDPGDQRARQRKRQLAKDLARVRLLQPTIDFEVAATYEPGSTPANKHLAAAAAGYRKHFESYRSRPDGLLARLCQGRCYQQLGQLSEALACFRELLELPQAEETRSLRTKSTRHALECLVTKDEKRYAEAIERGERWEQETGGSPLDSDALAIRYLTAVAYEAESTALPAQDPNRKKLAGFARQYVKPVAQHPGQYQRPAKTLLVALSGGKDADKDDAAPAFATAFVQAKEALARMQATSAQLSALAGQSDRTKIQELKRAKEANAAEARRALRKALRLSDEKVSQEDLNSARYYLCFLEWDAGNLYDAAVLGEFLARSYPETVPGRQGARIALAAYVKLYADAPQSDKQFEAAQVERVGQEILKCHTGSEEGDETILQLLSFAASRKQWDKARAYLEKVPADSPRRGQAELRAGQALWSGYLSQSQLPAGERPPQADLDVLKQQAQEVLQAGIARMQKSGTVDSTLASAVFAMAQICVDTDQPGKAINWLEHEKFGPLTLIESGHPLASRGNFAIEANKLALRAYIAVHPQQLEKAEAAMDKLEELVGGAGDAKAAGNLTAIYISLGRQLQQHLQDLRKSGQQKELEHVSKAFEIFLDRVTKRSAGNSFASLNWVGETYYSLGGGFDEGPAASSKKAKNYFAKAADAYQKLLKIAEDDPKFKDNPDSLIGIRLRLADCFRRAGDYDPAVNIAVAVIKEKPMLLPAQVQAAEILQDRGSVDPKAYGLAILGGQPGRDGKNAIWGWAKLSKLTMSDPKFRDTFHKARLNMAEARYHYAMSQEDKKKRMRILEAAKQDLWLTFKLRPNLGGEKTTAEYDRLLKKIQRNLGDTESGISEFRQRDAETTTTAATK